MGDSPRKTKAGPKPRPVNFDPNIVKYVDSGIVKKRPVLTISLSDLGMKCLEDATKAFQKLAERLPPWVEVPKTKAAVAAWLVNRNAEDAHFMVLAIIREAEGEMMDKNLAPDDPRPSEDPIPASYKEALDKFKDDPYFQAMKQLMKISYD